MTGCSQGTIEQSDERRITFKVHLAISIDFRRIRYTESKAWLWLLQHIAPLTAELDRASNSDLNDKMKASSHAVNDSARQRSSTPGSESSQCAPSRGNVGFSSVGPSRAKRRSGTTQCKIGHSCTWLILLPSRTLLTFLGAGYVSPYPPLPTPSASSPPDARLGLQAHKARCCLLTHCCHIQQQERARRTNQSLTW